MSTSEDSNASIWKSEEAVQRWVSTMGERERKRAGQWRIMGQLLPFGFDDVFVFLDLGAGTGAAARTILDLYPQSRAILADYSTHMMLEGARVLQPYDGRYEYVEYDMRDDRWPLGIPNALDAVLTSQCVHHLPDERKRSLFHEIFDRLAPGGWYLNLDPITAEDAEVEQAWKRANDREDPGSVDVHRTPEEQAQYENHVRYMVPLPLQLSFLHAAGFAAIDVYWKHLDYVIYGGCRPG